MFGAGRAKIGEQLVAAGTSFDKLGQTHKRPIYSTLDQVPDYEPRARSSSATGWTSTPRR